MQKNLPKYLAASLCVLAAFFMPVYKAPLPDGVSVHPPKPKQIKAIADVLSPAIASAEAITIEVPKAAPTSYPAPTGDAKAYIYDHESGNNPGAINAGSGACGLGQAWPCEKMPCSLSDYACQDAFFTQYMLGRYGSWEAAQNYWIIHHNW